MKNETIKTEWDLRSCFEQMRDANGDVMLTEKQQEEIVRLVEGRKKKWIKWPELEGIVKADGFDDAIIGIDEKTMCLIYSVSKCIEILSKDMSRGDAVDYFYFNMESAYVGEKTPIWCTDNF